MENENVNDNTPNVENDDHSIEAAEVDANTDANTTDVVALKEKLAQTEQANKQLFERAKKAEGFVKVDGKWVKPPKEEPKPKVEPKANTGGLDETALDFLDAKGITEAEDIEVIEKVVAKTGQTVRQALKDDYVVSKLAALKAERDVKNATPESMRRSGAGSSGDLASAIAKYEQTGELPSDFELRSAVVNKMEERASASRPPWRR